MSDVNPIEESVQHVYFQVGHIQAKRKDLTFTTEGEPSANDENIAVDIQFSTQEYALRVEMKLFASPEFAELDVLLASTWELPEDGPEVESFDIDVIQEFATRVAFPRTYSAGIAHMGFLARSIDVPVPALDFSIDRSFKNVSLTRNQETETN